MYIGRSVCVLLLLSLPLGMGRATVLFALLSFAFYVREPSESDTPHTLACTHTHLHTHTRLGSDNNSNLYETSNKKEDKTQSHKKESNCFMSLEYSLCLHATTATTTSL